MDSLHVFDELRFNSNYGTDALHVGHNVNITLPAKIVKRQSGKSSGNRKISVVGEILGFVKFCHLPAGKNEASGQGYIWYRQLPEEIYGASEDTEHIVSISCLDLASGDKLTASEEEISALVKEAPHSLKVEVLRRPYASRVSSRSVASDEQALSGGGVEHFAMKNVKKVSKLKGFDMCAAEPVDITVIVLSGSKNPIFHRPNHPSKKYSVRLRTEDKDFGVSSTAIYVKKVDSATNTVCFVKKSAECNPSDRTPVHYFNKIQFNRSDVDVMSLYVEVLEGDRIVLTKTFAVKVSTL